MWVSPKRPNPSTMTSTPKPIVKAACTVSVPPLNATVSDMMARLRKNVDRNSVRTSCPTNSPQFTSIHFCGQLRPAFPPRSVNVWVILTVTYATSPMWLCLPRAPTTSARPGCCCLSLWVTCFCRVETRHTRRIAGTRGGTRPCHTDS